jgi:hypothetical protein
LVKPRVAVNGNPVPEVMFVPKIKFPVEFIEAVPPMEVVPIITVLTEVIDKFDVFDIVNASIILTLPPKIETDPARLIVLLIEIFPLLPDAPIVSPFPDVFEEMG